MPLFTFLSVTKLVDRAVAAVAPGWGVKRMAARAAYSRMTSIMERAEARGERPSESPTNRVYEGAEADRLREGRWLGSRLSPDSALEEDLEDGRHHSREIFRNDSMGGAVDSRTAHVVGTGFKIRPRSPDKDINKTIRRRFPLWAKKCDRSGRESLWQLTRLVDRCFAVDGESFTVLSNRADPRKPISLTLEIIDADRVETPPQHANNPRIRLGIEKDGTGRIIAYWVRNSNPYDTKDLDMQYQRIPAERMLHVFDKWFPGQSRGLPWMIRVLNRIKDAKDLDEATIIKAQIDACLAVFIKNGQTSGSAAALGGASETVNGRRYNSLVPGMFYYLDGQEEADVKGSNTPGNNFEPFQNWNYRRVASGMAWGYESLIKNWSGLSFAGGRLALEDMRKMVRVFQQLLKEQWLDQIYEEYIREEVLAGVIGIDPRAYNKDTDLWDAHEWLDPVWGYAINPGEEVAAAADRVEENLGTLEDELAEYGYDLEDVIEQRKLERKMLREADILPPDQQSQQGTNSDQKSQPARRSRGDAVRKLAEALGAILCT